eukprot:CAMPEP_0181299830 /NCGR_PEP_ID=MMETSP1101-20121128/6562_1 /TAXON_ID=46948 /ORGANISM="Rhodomonas abbreviata, Strain Caron Lab Isolate" /LENGTH=352 /DNA_ID=CAMNT_0023405019 /DNA_START=336 /DNA_END=1391 /DNA_ORIENTATION=-
MASSTGTIKLITEGNAGDFLYDRASPLKAVLFTKKSETPNLWVRLAEAWGSKCKFGEIRHVETALMERFEMNENLLPKIIVMMQSSPEETETLTYDGPTDFEHISAFIGDAVQGGAGAVELRKKMEQQQRELKALRLELHEAKQAISGSQAEVARVKLGQVGQVEAVKKGLELEIQQAREQVKAAHHQLEEERAALNETVATLESAKATLELRISTLESVQHERVLLLSSSNVDAFFGSWTRPLKAILFTTKTDVPPLWSQLAEAQCITTAFAVVKHTDGSLMDRFNLTTAELPRICLYRESSAEGVVYDGNVNLEALTSFFKEAVEGGEACVELRKEIHRLEREVERLEGE